MSGQPDLAGRNRGLEELAAFLSQTRLMEVRTTRLAGELAEDVPYHEVSHVLAALRAEYRPAGPGFQCRLSVEVPLQVAHQPVGSIAVTIIETFTLDGGFPPSQELLSQFVRSRAIPAGMPYLEDAIQLMGEKLGLGSIAVALPGEAQGTSSGTGRKRVERKPHSRSQTRV